MVYYDRTIFENLESEGVKHFEKIIFKVVQMKFLTMQIYNQMKFWYIYGKKCSKYLHGTWS